MLFHAPPERLKTKRFPSSQGEGTERNASFTRRAKGVQSSRKRR
jgi:hypothetical protein